MELFDANVAGGGTGGAGSFLNVLTSINRTLERIKVVTERLRELGTGILLNTSALKSSAFNGGVAQSVGGRGMKLASGPGMGPAAASRASGAGGVGGVGGAAAAAASGGGVLAGIGAALGAVGTAAAVASAALAAAAASATAMTYVARHFAEYVNPGAVLAFDQSIRDLSAVVGLMLTPIVAEATKFIRAFGGELLGLANTVIPLVSQMAAAFANFLIGFLPAMTAIAKSLLSVFSFSGVAKHAAVFAQTLAKVSVLLYAFALRLLGLTEMMGALTDDLGQQKRADATGLAAATNPQFTNVANLGREAMQRAFIQTGRDANATPEVDDKLFRKELFEMVQRIKNGDLKQVIVEALKIFFAERLPGAQAREGLKNVGKGAATLDPTQAGVGLLQMFTSIL